jgi:hypothetical protein
MARRGSRDNWRHHDDDTVGNPCAVVDCATDRVLLLVTHNRGAASIASIVDGGSRGTRSAWMTHTDDGGATWSPPCDITLQVKKLEWT